MAEAAGAGLGLVLLARLGSRPLAVPFRVVRDPRALAACSASMPT